MNSKKCVACNATFTVSDEDLAFYQKISPSFGGDDFPIPPPTHCPVCRMRRRLTWRNEYSYYSRSCDQCQKKVISIHSLDKPYPVYCNHCWWSDSWNGLDYGREWDPTRPFLDQFIELLETVPQLAMISDNGIQSENCDYCQDLGFSKDCYLVTGSWRLQNVMYSSNCNHGRDLVDCDSVNLNGELVYESSDSQGLYHCAFLRSSANCNNCYFGLDLRGCSDCVGCVGLRQKKFHIWNKPYSESEYRKKIEELNLGSYSQIESLRKQFAEFVTQFPRKASHQLNCDRCIGDNLFNCKEVVGFDIFNGEHSKFFCKGDAPKHCYDVHQSGNPQWCYECITPDDSYQACFSNWCWKSKFIYYSDNCHSSENLIGCCGLKRTKYCILNKQYGKEEYEQITSEIIRSLATGGQWGEFFPADRSPFRYEETLASEWFPKDKAEKLIDSPAGGAQLADQITDIQDSITKERLTCSSCSRDYRITTAELGFYRSFPLPLPRKCSDCRRKNRNSLRNAYRFWERNCTGCSTAILSSVSPKQSEKVLCESCYNSYLSG